ncbi:hypothetical protein D1B31_02075 [Neobacillus notoginsengisoli]|uniref:Replicative helicase inhibitor G39P N-terminal domain-containing protein n=1 Tax=Neobacillus notoginsengisoli TaxID=1578198 RepID=A0A417YZZ1_9BACI|nr:hypothetical protein [Neobacillus notoginsengisoli]RHW43470.1 hypothetical protein D1B31_02075 [Neobacillus notoginsengisoli]
MMTKREIYTILKMTASYYDQFVIDQEKVDNWHKVLKESTFEQCEQRLMYYAAASPYPPKLCDFANKPAGAGRAIPNCQETLEVLWQTDKQASNEVAKFHMEKIRKILGIERGS